MFQRSVLVLGIPLLVAGCIAGPQPQLARGPAVDPTYQAMYAALPGERFTVPGIDTSLIDPAFLRQEIVYSGLEPPGTVVVDPSNHFLYLVREGGRALRYGIGVGREGFAWSGDATVARKAAWPTWTPPAEMVARDPRSAPWAKGMPGGPSNPLGARAMYLYQGNRDTIFRIHGTVEPESIGKSVSSGCIRLLNQDIIDLYSRVPVGSRIVVLPTERSPESPPPPGRSS